MASGVRDVSITFVFRILGLVIAIGSQACLAWFLGPAGRGSYAVCLLFSTVLGLFCTIGVGATPLYFVASKKFNISQGVMHSLIFIGLGSILAVFVGLGLLHTNLGFVSKASPTAFRLALVLIPMQLLSMTLLQLLTAVREFAWFGIATIVQLLLQLVLFLVLVGAASWGVTGAMLALIVSSASAAFLSLVVFRLKHGLILTQPSMRSLGQMFSYGMRYYVGKVSSVVNIEVGTIVLAMSASESDVGMFAVASAMTRRVEIIPYILNLVLIPRIAADSKGRPQLVAQCARLSAIVCGLLLLVLAVFARPVVCMLFSEKFLPAVVIIRIMAVGMLLRCASKNFGTYLVCTNRPGAASATVCIGMAVNLVLMWLLLPVMGLVGAALATAANFFVSSIILMGLFRWRSGLGFGQTWRFTRSDWSMLAGMFRRGRNHSATEETTQQDPQCPSRFCR